MMTQIGIVSGKILTLLEERGGLLTLQELEDCLDEPLEVILMSLGWLIRQGYIHASKTEYKTTNGRQIHESEILIFDDSVGCAKEDI